MTKSATAAPAVRNQADPFLEAKYVSLHDSPRQRKFRKIAPWPCGVVFVQNPEWDLEEIRRHFQLMRELGFTALKQCQVCPHTDKATVMHTAIDEGIIPWWYGEAGWEEPTEELLKELGIDPKISMSELRENEAWLQRQKQVMHERVDREAAGQAGPAVAKQQSEAPDRKRGADWVPSVQPDFKFELDEQQVPLFMTWLKNHYASIEDLNDAWNVHHCMSPGPVDRKGGDGDGGDQLIGWRDWDHLESQLLTVINGGGGREYRRARDVLRFKADNYINWLRDRLQPVVEADPNAPVRAGGEMGLFLPFAARGTDMEGIADLMTEWGSFYPSFHPAWHLEEVEFETPIPYYMQSSITTDWFKGGWNATWEATGGPQQMTGHKAPFVPEVRDMKPGVTMDAGAMRQLMLSWIAGGYRGWGQWCWSMRTFGWEGGEFALLDRNYRPTDRAEAAGKIGKACRRLRDELWQANKQPQVGVFQDWDMEAIWAASGLRGRDFFPKEPIRGRIGAARALINANVPWEHVTATDLREGLAPRYQTIYLPACLALDDGLMELLRDYVQAGGRVVLDAPGGWYDYYGRVMQSDDGSPFERLFGARLADFQFSRWSTRPWKLDGRTMEGTILEVQPTTAEVTEQYDHGKPAVTTHRLGQGEAVILTWEAAKNAFRPGQDFCEQAIVKYALGDQKPRYACNLPTYHLAAPQADHFFIMNPGEATTARLDVRDRKYSATEDPIDQQAIDLKAIALDEFSAAWVRCVK